MKILSHALFARVLDVHVPMVRLFERVSAFNHTENAEPNLRFHLEDVNPRHYKDPRLSASASAYL